MRLFWQVSLCCLLAGGAGTVFAQRGGGGGRGGMGGGSFGGGVFPGGAFPGSGFAGGGFNGGFNGGAFNGGTFNGGGFTGGGFTGGFGFHGPIGVFNLGGNINRPGDIHAVGFPFGFFGGREFGNGFGFNNGFYGAGLYGYGGYGFWPASGYPSYLPDYAYSSYYPGYDYPYAVSGYSSTQTSPHVTVLYPTQSTVPPLSAERAHPVMKEYDQNGQEIRPGGSPLYLIAMKDHTIAAATTYRVEGSTLHYTTQQNENKDVSLDSVDRSLSVELNRERQVPFNLPPQ